MIFPVNLAILDVLCEESKVRAVHADEKFPFFIHAWMRTSIARDATQLTHKRIGAQTESGSTKVLNEGKDFSVCIQRNLIFNNIKCFDVHIDA